MGLYDRDYYREEPESSGWRPAGYGTGGYSMVTILIVINVAVFVLDAFSPEVVQGSHVHWLGNILALRSDVFTHPWLAWELITYGFAHAAIDSPQFIWHVGFNMFGLWMFGRFVEQIYGRNEFLAFYLATVIFSGLIWAMTTAVSGIDSRLVGASGAVTGVVILFVLNVPNQRVSLLFLPMIQFPAWVFGIIFVGLDVLGAMGAGRGEVAYVAHLGGALGAFIYFQTKFRFTSLGRLGEVFKRRPKLKVHDPDRKERQTAEQADAVLAKLHREGEASLTAKERRILENYSRSIRNKRQ